ncbi:hypothetical protein D3C81_1138820 [compost metagenome]
MRLLELTHRVVGIAAEIAVGLQHLAIHTGVAGLRQLLLQREHFIAAFALHQHTVGHRCTRRARGGLTMRRLAERLFVGLAQVRLRVVVDPVVARQRNQLGLFIERALAQRIPLLGRALEMALDVGVLVILHGPDNLLVTQLGQLVIITIGLFQAILEYTTGHVAILHRRAPQRVLHGRAATLQVHADLLQAIHLHVVILVLDEIVLFLGEALFVACGHRFPALAEGFRRRLQAVELVRIAGRLQVLVHPANGAGELVAAIGHAAMVTLARGNPAWTTVVGFKTGGGLAAMPVFHRLPCIGHYIHVEGLLSVGNAVD